MSTLKKNIIFSFFILGMIPFISFSQTNFGINLTGTNAKCNGNANGSAMVTAIGGTAPYTYAWNTSPLQTTASASNLVSGTYKVLVTDANNVSITDSITISEPAALIVYIDSIIVQPCFLLTGGGSCGCGNTLWAVVNGGTAPYKYYWSPGGQRTDSIFNVCYVNFTVNVTDTNQCATSASLNVVIPPKVSATRINQVTNNFQIKVYPNPANNQLSVSLQETTDNTKIEIYDMLGNKVKEQKINAALLANIDVANLSEGNYFLRVIDANGQKTTRFSINR